MAAAGFSAVVFAAGFDAGYSGLVVVEAAAFYFFCGSLAGFCCCAAVLLGVAGLTGAAVGA